MSGKSYPQLHQRIRDLIAQGSKVCDEEAGTRGAQIHQWLSESRYCLAFLDDKIPTALSDFQRVRQDCVFKLADDEEALASESAYRDDGDVLWDFRFEKLQQALGILNLASRKLEMEG
ncbi:MAG TPA: hypothetical protein VHW45_15190, partial [Candidatus Sulfotelmatobacter sp.]|nr:hypothetical protein [Candidatus Sulfotelmatobacter sp.]